MTPSPCINLCRLDAEQRLCLGCFRTLEEIGNWSKADETARARILAAVAQRRQEHAPSNGELSESDHHG